MTILAVDDEKLALEGLMRSIRAAAPEADVRGFRDPEEALRFAETIPLYAVFLDIEMRGMDGITLAKQLLQTEPKTNIIFTTGYGEYAGRAFDLHASGYIMKPVTEEKVRRELSALRYRAVPALQCANAAGASRDHDSQLQYNRFYPSVSKSGQL